MSDLTHYLFKKYIEIINKMSILKFFDSQVAASWISHVQQDPGSNLPYTDCGCGNPVC